MELAKIQASQEKFELAVQEAANMSLIQNGAAAFKAVVVVKNLRDALTDDIMKEVFMPLMNTKIGFLTDRPVIDKRSGRQTKPAYSIDIVRDSIIDGASYGLLPTFNQMNIIAERMYPTKEGYTYLLKKLKVKYLINFGQDISKADAKISEISFKINYEFNGEQKSLVGMANNTKTAYSSYGQQKGKAERTAKKVLYEYITGLDLGDADTIDIESEDVTEKVKHQEDGESKKINI